MTKSFSVQSPESAMRLWVNEVSRVFHDRLINNEDRRWFTEHVTELVNNGFRIKVEHDELFINERPRWGDLLKLEAPTPLYEEIKDLTKLKKTLVDQLDDFNMSGSNKMNLVFFDDCIEHILRIARVLRQPRGNAMLIGVGGSGKQSVTRLASSMLKIMFRQVEITKNYGPDQFKEFVKELMFSAGIDGTPISFVLTDTQIIDESFLEDINNVLNTGEIPNLME